MSATTELLEVSQDVNYLTKSKRNIVFDLFRFVLATMIICIHFGFNFFKFEYYPIFRLAVPTFFMISGFFIFKEDKKKELDRSVVFIKSSLKYVLIGFLIYLIYDILRLSNNTGELRNYVAGLFVEDAFLTLFIKNNVITSGNHLWFLLALLSLSIFNYVMVRFNLSKWYPFIGIIMFPIYLWICLEVKLFGDVHFRVNWIFVGLPAFSIGYGLRWLTSKLKNINAWWSVVFFVLGCVFMILQVYECQWYLKVDMAYYFCSLLSAICFVLFCHFLGEGSKHQKVENFQQKISDWFYKWVGPKSTFYIYILHMIIGRFCVKFLAVSGIPLVLIIFIISFLVYEICYLITKFYKYILNV